MTLLAAFEVLLLRYSGQEDLAVGTSIANRNRVEIESLIGCFVNTLVLRGRLEGNPAFRELLERVREAALGAYAHQDMPFEKLVEELSPERNLSYTPLFQVMFVMQNAPTAELEFAGLRLSPVEVETATAKCDLVMTVEEQAEGLSVRLEYNADVFDRTTAERMLGHYRRLLEAVVDNSEQRIWDLPLLSAGEIQLLQDWNRTERDYPRECVHELFAKQAGERADAVAVVSGEEQISYGELEKKGNQ